MGQPVDISDWKAGETLSIGGTREKDFVIDPDTQEVWFVKYPKENAPLETQPLEVMTEYLATELAKQLGLPTHTCYPVRYKSRIGLVNKLLCDRHTELIYPKQLIPTLNVSSKDLSWSVYLENHTIDNVMEAFYAQWEQQMGKTTPSEEIEPFFASAILAPFIDMLLFDAWIGNGDRNSENYGIMNKLELTAGAVKIGISQFSPLYDMSSCLFWNSLEERLPVADKELEKHAHNTKKGNSHITIPGQPRIHHFTLLRYINSMKFRSIPLAQMVEERYNQMERRYNELQIDAFLERIQDSTFLSNQRLMLISRYLKYRWSLIQSVFGGTL